MAVGQAQNVNRKQEQWSETMVLHEAVSARRDCQIAKFLERYEV